MPVPTHGLTEAKVLPQFDKDIRDLHLIYDYDAHDSNGKPEKWRYEMYFTTLSPETLIPLLERTELTCVLKVVLL
jgi:hypothetical protein